MLLQRPTVSESQIAFVYAGDLWTVSRNGGEAARLTTGAGIETNPYFSPDGQWIAFTGQYDGNTDVFVIAATGGTPRRLTYHPAADICLGWTPDGKQVIFRSNRHSYSPRYNKLFTVPIEGGFPTELPLPTGEEASFSPDGSRLAYVPLGHAFAIWKRYRGGQTTPVWIATLSDSSIERVPRDNSNDFNPMWIGDKVYFLSDRGGPVSLYEYDTRTKRVSEAVRNNGLDIKSASAGPGVIVYEQFGSLHLYDLNGGKEHAVNVTVRGDLLEVRSHFENVARQIRNADISPTGVRAVFEAHGDILTVPAEKGDIRDLTNTPAAEERDPSWSPDGKWIAYFSDEAGEYELYLMGQSGMGEPRKISLGNPPSFFYSPVWSPDSKKIAYTDKRLNLWYVDIDKGSPVKIDTNSYEDPYRVLDPAWSPDSEWITYTKQLRNRLCAVFLFSLDDGKVSQVSDGMSDARYAQFDKGGKYLFFTASTNAGPAEGWLDMSSYPYQVTRSVYVVVLAKDVPSPLAPESDEEKPSAAPPPASPKPAAKAPVTVKIDLENIGQRILALPIPARAYTSLEAGKAGEIFLAFREESDGAGPGFPGTSIHKFDLPSRKETPFLNAIQGFVVSFNGEKALYSKNGLWSIVPTVKPPTPGEGALKTQTMEVKVDPRAEWKQMYNEVWRIERDFFYDPKYHGLDLETAEKKYSVYLDGLGSRADLNYLFSEMLGELTVGHLFVSGGEVPQPPSLSVGLLGADYSIENGRYRFSRIYNGENWNPQLQAPLTQPGVNVTAGDYLLAVNGSEVKSSDNVYSFFLDTAGKQVVLKVGADPGGANSREVTVIPVANDLALRNRAWIEDNRRKVDQLSGGKLAYVYLPDTAGGGYTNFNRYFFAQIDKHGVVVDERFNSGGSASDYIIDYLRRNLLNYWYTREGGRFTTPAEAIYGPKAMIINQYAGSGGDALPWYFRRSGLGPLVGERTWGGLVGIYSYPSLMDGGSVTAPRVAFWNPNGTWDVENHGVAPDVEVELDPKAVREGHDPQLERAVEVVMDELAKHPEPNPKIPAFPDYHHGNTLGRSSTN